ncbi:hypothetical protein ASPWEDRAFT_688816 [Aspergillus wentii DTO 134E9]|uniref:Heterokaryon incompatibility domain-containing protein n=1 Tax=Aspergillus wentii DTO 134E9 TaxID=1073089 RepID=A0A1L9R8H3_ASPWE|nr:uncharacterized protein ASPWEDRAFT_688816 [Aspergillus wentii DTO 134E9]OJJ31226.1 hypothetical protein ASPWEDRAFT_688816 [Aspergillus wentii DTO 134E9]
MFLSIPSPWVDWNVISTWLRDCDSGIDHEASCHAEKFSFPGFRIIDTDKRCVVFAPESCMYATLSYVWGDKSDSLQATTKNITSLGAQGSLSSEKLQSATINDAIDACCSLHIPFLWVDRLCILQDQDSGQKKAQLDAMGNIYSGSYVTLVAMAGDDATYGLPGVNERKRSPTWTGQTQGLHLLEVPWYYKLLKGSKWQTRGWTCQEAVMSPRLLLLSDQGTFYECRGQSRFKNEDHGNQQQNFKPSYSLCEYTHLIGEFTQRDLSHKSDILYAISGILHSRYNQQHFYGLPFDEFSSAILWKTTDGKYPPRPQCPTQVFPSWSWSSIDNAIEVDPQLQGYPGQIVVSLSQWAIPSLTNTQSPLNILRDTIRYFYISEEVALLSVLIAWKGGCFPGRLPEELNVKTTWEQYVTIMRDRWSCLSEISDEAHGMSMGVLPAHDQELRFPYHLQQACYDGCILAYAQSRRLRIQIPENPQDYVKLCDKKGTMIAWLQEGTVNWEHIHNIPRWNDGAEFDVLAVSIPSDIDGRPSPSHLYKKEKLADWKDSKGEHLFYGNKASRPFIRLFWVSLMVVETKNGISKRVALAESFLKVWIKAKPRFHTFILG